MHLAAAERAETAKEAFAEGKTAEAEANEADAIAKRAKAAEHLAFLPGARSRLPIGALQA